MLVRSLAALLLLGSAVQAKAVQIPFLDSQVHSVADTKGHGHHSHKSLLHKNFIGKIDSLLKAYNVPGLSVGVIAGPKYTKDGWIAETHSFGVADGRESPVTGDSLFAIASNSKLFTASAIGLLIQNRTLLPNGAPLSYETKVIDILGDDWELQDSYAASHVSVRDLLSMQSGMPRHDNSNGMVSPESVLANIGHLRPSHELRQVWQYNNHHYFVLAIIVERLSGLALDVYVTTHIFEPLGMTHTTYNGTIAGATGHRTEGFVRNGFNLTTCERQWHRGNKLDEACLGVPASIGWWSGKTDGVFEAGPGGVISSAADLNIWLKELLKPQILPRAVVEEMVKATSVPSGQSGMNGDPEMGVATYGQGQQMRTYRGYRTIYHGGDLPGMATNVIRLPDQDIGVNILCNDGIIGYQIHTAISRMVIDALLDLHPIDWAERGLIEQFESTPKFAARPKHPRPAPEPVDVIGLYYDEGYGDLSVLPVPQVPEAIHLQTSELEERLIGDSDDFLRLALGDAGVNLTGIYYAVIKKAFTDLLIFTPFDGPIYNWTAVAVPPLPYGPPGHFGILGRGSGSAVFSAEEGGVGMFGNFYGADQGRPAVESEVEKSAEVWYKRVSRQ